MTSLTKMICICKQQGGPNRKINRKKQITTAFDLESSTYSKQSSRNITTANGFGSQWLQINGLNLARRVPKQQGCQTFHVRAIPRRIYRFISATCWRNAAKPLRRADFHISASFQWIAMFEPPNQVSKRREMLLWRHFRLSRPFKACSQPRQLGQASA